MRPKNKHKLVIYGTKRLLVSPPDVWPKYCSRLLIEISYNRLRFSRLRFTAEIYHAFFKWRTIQQLLFSYRIPAQNRRIRQNYNSSRADSDWLNESINRLGWSGLWRFYKYSPPTIFQLLKLNLQLINMSWPIFLDQSLFGSVYYLWTLPQLI